MPNRNETELERRQRQLEVIEHKAKRAEQRKDDAGMEAARISYESTKTRIAELEAEGQEPTPRRRGRREE